MCTDGVLRSCVDGQWRQTVCPDGCADDRTCRSTGTLCTDGETACSGDVLQICVNGAWQEQLCPYGCDASGKSCAVPAVCEAGVQLCESGTLKKCENNVWKVVQNCENGCLPGGNACATCNNGAVKCQNGKLSTCAAGQWQETSCQNGCNAAAVIFLKYIITPWSNPLCALNAIAIGATATPKINSKYLEIMIDTILYAARIA